MPRSWNLEGDKLHKPDQQWCLIFTICVSLRQRRYTMTHQCLPWGELDNLLAGKNVPIRSLQIMVITNPSFRTDQMWLSNQTTGLWMLKMTIHDCNCVSHGILVYHGCNLILCNMYVCAWLVCIYWSYGWHILTCFEH